MTSSEAADETTIMKKLPTAPKFTCTPKPTFSLADRIAADRKQMVSPKLIMVMVRLWLSFRKK